MTHAPIFLPSPRLSTRLAWWAADTVRDIAASHLAAFMRRPAGAFPMLFALCLFLSCAAVVSMAAQMIVGGV